MAGAVQWEMSTKQLAAFEKRVARYRGLPLRKRMAKGNLLAAQYLVRPIRAAAPLGLTGNLRKRVKARQTKASSIAGVSFGTASRYGGTVYQTVGASVGSTARHRHLVIRGHRIVTHAGRDTGKRSIANPFVDEAAAPHVDDAQRIVSRALWGPD